MQLLDLGREDVLAAGDDHVVVAAVDEQPAVLVDVPDVAGRHHPVDDLLAAAAGVALELHRAADEDAPGLAAAATSLPSSSSSLIVVPVRRPADGARRGPHVRRRGDRGVRDLGRAVEVVDDVAEQVHRARREVGRQRRTGQRDDAQRVAGRASRSRPRRARCSRDSRIGTVISASARCSSSASSVNSGSALRAMTSVLPRPSASIELSSPHAWNAGRGEHDGAPRAQRDLRQVAARQRQRQRHVARRALGGAGRAARQQHDLLLRARAGAGGPCRPLSIRPSRVVVGRSRRRARRRTCRPRARPPRRPR